MLLSVLGGDGRARDAW